MSATPVELDLGSGIVAFDGRIVEAFGFDIGDSDSRRVHIEMVEEVELAEGRYDMLRIHGRGASGWGVTLKLDQSRRAELEQFMQQVRDAAPNLREGR